MILRMRALRRPSVGLLLVAGVIGAGIAIDAPPGYATNDTSLVVSPGVGGADAQFTVRYRSPTVRIRKHLAGCLLGQITFQWDGVLLGRAASTEVGGSCVATLNATPPPGAYQGASSHTLTVTNDASARATYTVTEGTDGTQPSAGAADPGADPQPTEFVGVPAGPPDGVGSTAVTGGQPGAGSGVTGWLIAFGAVLVLTGGGALGFFLWRIRRPEPDAEGAYPSRMEPSSTDAWSSKDMDNTRVLPVRDRATRRAAHRAR
jgi:hypothetical protein